MKRKYRFLKPNELIKYGDHYQCPKYMTNNEDIAKWPSITKPNDFAIETKMTPASYTDLIWARYVGPIAPPRPYHPKTQATDLPDSTAQ